ncbi:39S ribosomal protein L47, mitochondrial [Lobulomyces angularis]|nr:39S ribosomal protein L47, mitochondrial [Lobulomyces angularis]
MNFLKNVITKNSSQTIISKKFTTNFLHLNKNLKNLSQLTRSLQTSSKCLGLEEFFDNSKGWTWKDTDFPTGRSWEVNEVRRKSFEDLHALWWVCIKQKNLLLSQKEECRRFRLIFPNKERLSQVKKTMKYIKFVLWERKVNWEKSQDILNIQTLKMKLINDLKEEKIAKSPELKKAQELKNKKSNLDEKYIIEPEDLERVELEKKKNRIEQNDGDAVLTSDELNLINKTVFKTVKVKALPEHCVAAALDMTRGDITEGKPVVGLRRAKRGMYGYAKKKMHKKSSWFII